jgi:hypothetical protein
MKTKSLMLAAALFFAIPANAATVLVDISAQDGFRSFGSGVRISPAFTFQPGDTVNFGTAIMGADPASINCALGAPCIISGRLPHVDAFFLTDGVGPSDGRIIQDLTSFGALRICVGGVSCDPPSVTSSLVFTIPQDKNGIELAFLAWGLTMTPPVVVTPLPATLPLFAGGLLLLGWMSRRKLTPSAFVLPGRAL